MIPLQTAVWVVTMRRWGDDESHNYLLGVFSDECKALKAGTKERDYRGCKYEPKLEQVVIDNVC